MKNNLFTGRASKFFLGVFCLILAVICWYAVEYGVLENLSALATNFG